MSEGWQSYVRRIEELAARSGLEFHRVDFEAVPDSFMMEIAVYGLPVRMPHWSFGVRYIYQLIQRHMGHSRLFEVVFPGNPGHAYLAESNGLAENILVTAHVLGHADFARKQPAVPPLPGAGERAHRRARRQSRTPDSTGHRDLTVRNAFEVALDAALALEQHVDINQPLRRERYPEYLGIPRCWPTTNSASASRRSSRSPRQRAGGEEARTAAAASGARPAVVRRQLRTGDGELGA